MTQGPKLLFSFFSVVTLILIFGACVIQINKHVTVSQYTFNKETGTMGPDYPHSVMQAVTDQITIRGATLKNREWLSTSLGDLSNMELFIIIFIFFLPVAVTLKYANFKILMQGTTLAIFLIYLCLSASTMNWFGYSYDTSGYAMPLEVFMVGFVIVVEVILLSLYISRKNKSQSTDLGS